METRDDPSCVGLNHRQLIRGNKMSNLSFFMVLAGLSLRRNRSQHYALGPSWNPAGEAHLFFPHRRGSLLRDRFWGAPGGSLSADLRARNTAMAAAVKLSGYTTSSID